MKILIVGQVVGYQEDFRVFSTVLPYKSRDSPLIPAARLPIHHTYTYYPATQR
jgi:hypothetical protein